MWPFCGGSISCRVATGNREMSNMTSPSKMVEAKIEITNRLMAVKRRSCKSYTQIAAETGLTNVYVAQLLRRQAQLKPDTGPRLRAALPELTDDLLQEMTKPPLRSYDPNLIQEPTVYRWDLCFSHYFNSLACFTFKGFICCWYSNSGSYCFSTFLVVSFLYL